VPGFRRTAATLLLAATLTGGALTLSPSAFAATSCPQHIDSLVTQRDRQIQVTMKNSDLQSTSGSGTNLTCTYLGTFEMLFFPPSGSPGDPLVVPNWTWNIAASRL
jgi:hypothetical protein